MVVWPYVLYLHASTNSILLSPFKVNISETGTFQLPQNISVHLNHTFVSTGSINIPHNENVKTQKVLCGSDLLFFGTKIQVKCLE